MADLIKISVVQYQDMCAESHTLTEKLATVTAERDKLAKQVVAYLAELGTVTAERDKLAKQVVAYLAELERHTVAIPMLRPEPELTTGIRIIDLGD